MNPDSDETSEQTEQSLKDYGKRLAVLLMTSTFPDEIKDAWVALVPKMTLPQMDRLMDVLEKRMAKNAPENSTPAPDQTRTDIDELGALLQTDALDQETKLGIIDLVAFGKDPEMTKDPIVLLAEWKKSDEMTVAILKEKLEEIQKSTEEKQNKLKEKRDHNLSIVQDKLATAQKIEEIRKSILGQS